MARPEKQGVDYFPFTVKDGKTLQVLQSKYKGRGTGFFTNVLRWLAQRPGHYFEIKDDGDLEWFLSFVMEEKEDALNMIELMTKTGKIDKDLWEQKRIIVSEDFSNSILPAYARRTKKPPTIDEIKGFCNLNGVSVCNNPDEAELIQAKVHKENKIKENKRKENKIPSDSPESSDDKNYEFEFEEFWKLYPRRIEKQKAFKCWKARIKEKHNPEDMIKAAYNYREVCKIQDTEEKYIKHPATFLGANKPFLDYLTMPKVTPPARAKPNQLGESYDHSKGGDYFK